MRRLLVIFLFSIFIFPLSTLAWNAYGHMVIASIAYQNLKPNTRVKIDKLVDSMNQQYPEMKSFLHIAYWPDAIRAQKIESYTHWHYINTTFSSDGSPLKNLTNTDNAVWAIDKIEPVIQNNRANVYERARFLAFLIHIVGDLHQPLHTVSKISATMLDGDQGGNNYFVYYNHAKIKLHKLWDSGVGDFAQSNSIGNVTTTAKAIMALYPENSFGNKTSDLEPEHWAKEGMMNAKTYAYATPENEAVSQAYVKNGKRISEQQAALAGYRLANLLNQLIQ